MIKTDNKHMDLKYIQQEAKLSNARLSAGRNQNFRPVKNLDHLLNILTTKNHKIQDQRLINRLREDQGAILLLDTQENFQALVKQEIANNRQTPFQQRNQLAHLQSLKHRNSNTLLLFQANQNLKAEVKKSQLFSKSNLEEEEIKFQIPTVLLTDQDTLDAVIAKGKEESEKTAKKPLNSFTKTKKASDKMDEKIVGYIKHQSTRESVNQELEVVSAQLDLKNPGRVFAILNKILNQKMNIAKEKNLTVFEHFHRVKVNDHYDLHLRIEHKFESEIKFRTKFARKGKPYENPEIQQSQRFFCRCFLLFLGGQKAKSQLIKELEGTTHSHFIDVIESFFKYQEPQESKQNLDMCLYTNSIFYRMFVKVIFLSDFSPQEEELFRGNEKRIFVYFQLKYRKEFQRTMIYKMQKDQIFNELLEMIKLQDRSDVQRVLNKIVQIGQFDNIYFKLFSSSEHSITPLQNLFLLCTLVFEEQLLAHSIHTRVQWAAQILHQLFRLVQTVNSQNTQCICMLIISMLRKCEPELGSGKIVEIVSNLIHENYVLINCPNNVELIEKNLPIFWKDMETILLKSFYNYKDFTFAMKQHLSYYINFDDPAYTLKIPQNGKISNLLLSQRENNLSQNTQLTMNVGKMLKEKPEENKYKNMFFVLGLKLFTKSFINFCTNEEKASEQQNKKYIQYFSVTLRKIKNLVEKIYEMNGPNTLNSQSSGSVSAQIKARDQNLSNFINQIQQIVDICDLFRYLYVIGKDFGQTNKIEAMIKVSSEFEDFVAKKGKFENLLNRVNDNMNWLFIEDVNSGYRTLFDYFEVLYSIIDTKYDWKSRKITPEKMMISHAHEFLDSFLTVCITTTKEMIKTQYKNSFK